MFRTLRVAFLSAALSGLVSPVLAAPVGASPQVQGQAKFVRPLSLTSTGSLNFGTIVVNGLTANRTIALSSLNFLNCAGGSPEVACSGATSVARYNVRGTRGQVVTIIKTPSNLANGNDGTTLSLMPTGSSALTLPNSGAPGVDFTIGGNITITPTTTDGVYTGTVNVEVDYN